MDPTDDEPTRWQAGPRLQSATILGIGLVAGVLFISAGRLMTGECINPTDDWRTNPCLDRVFGGLALLLVTPFLVFPAMLAAAGLRLLRARDVWAGALFPLAVFAVTRSLVRLVTALEGELRTGSGLLPWPLWPPLSIGVLAACWLLVRKAPTPRWVRLAPALVVAAVAMTIPPAADVAQRVELSSRLDDATVSLHLPEFPGAGLHSVNTERLGGPRRALSFYFWDGEQGPSVSVALLDARGQTTCDTLAKKSSRVECPPGSDSFNGTDEYDSPIAVHRHGDTVLMAHSHGVSPEALVDAIAAAPPVDTPTVIAALPPGPLK